MHALSVEGLSHLWSSKFSNVIVIINLLITYQHHYYVAVHRVSSYLYFIFYVMIRYVSDCMDWYYKTMDVACTTVLRMYLIVQVWGTIKQVIRHPIRCCRCEVIGHSQQSMMRHSKSNVNHSSLCTAITLTLCVCVSIAECNRGNNKHKFPRCVYTCWSIPSLCLS